MELSEENLEKAIIQLVNERNFDTWEVSKEKNIDHTKLVGIVKSLAADEFVLLDQVETSFYELTDEAKGYLANGSPEIVLMKQIINDSGISVAEAKKHGFGFANIMKKKWVQKDTESEKFLPKVTVDKLADDLQDKLKILEDSNGSLDALPAKEIKDLNKRQLLKHVTIKHYKVKKGPKWATERKKAAAGLTREMLESGSWKTETFKPPNFRSTGLRQAAGYLHPLLMVKSEYRNILISMGFEEMPTNRWVESSFWNFDALFQPQQHPARDAHDTFFIKYPELSNLENVPEEYIKKVKNVHETGGYESIGYRYNWSLNEAKKNILRTHTTAVSTRMLYNLGQEFEKTKVFTPKKLFSIDRVFRNESLDATHLAEFHQIEGLIADYDLTLGHLMATIREFFGKTGIKDIRFKPAYNPYTEPSMEIFGYHPDLKKWTEIGNSGMFRPEMLQPMGLPKGVRVIAWGLGLERPTMIKYRFKKIKELFGHKVSLEATQNLPLPRIS